LQNKFCVDLILGIIKLKVFILTQFNKVKSSKRAVLFTLYKIYLLIMFVIKLIGNKNKYTGYWR